MHFVQQVLCSVFLCGDDGNQCILHWYQVQCMQSPRATRRVPTLSEAPRAHTCVPMAAAGFEPRVI